MSTLFYGFMNDGNVPADQEAVRRNTPPVHNDGPPAEAKGAPEWNEPETDPNPELGMSGRQVASDWHESEHSVPFWTDSVDNATEANAIVNRQVSSSGKAAAKEKSGEWGHGTTAYAVGIEPVIREGGAFGNDYFAAHNPEAQSTMTAEFGVQPAMGLDRDDIAGFSSYGKSASHEAATAGQRNDWYQQLIDGGR